MEYMLCSSCSSESQLGAVYCQKCGTKLIHVKKSYEEKSDVFQESTNINQFQMEIDSLKYELKSIKNNEHNYLLGIFQGFIISLITWFIIVPIVQWITNATFPIKFIVILINFITPIGMFAALIGDSKTTKQKARAWSYLVFEVIIIVYYLINWPWTLLYTG